MTRLTVFILSAGLALGAAQTSEAARTKDGMIAQSDPSRPGTFEVLSKPGAGPSEYWCAAGDYALRFLHRPVATRLYVVRGPGPSSITPGRTSVVFTYVESQEVLQSAISGGGLEPGSNMRAAQGQSTCNLSSRRDRR